MDVSVRCVTIYFLSGESVVVEGITVNVTFAEVCQRLAEQQPLPTNFVRTCVLPDGRCCKADELLPAEIGHLTVVNQMAPWRWVVVGCFLYFHHSPTDLFIEIFSNGSGWIHFGLGPECERINNNGLGRCRRAFSNDVRKILEQMSAENEGNAEGPSNFDWHGWSLRRVDADIEVAYKQVHRWNLTPSGVVGVAWPKQVEAMQAIIEQATQLQ